MMLKAATTVALAIHIVAGNVLAQEQASETVKAAPEPTPAAKASPQQNAKITFMRALAAKQDRALQLQADATVTNALADEAEARARLAAAIKSITQTEREIDDLNAGREIVAEVTADKVATIDNTSSSAPATGEPMTTPEPSIVGRSRAVLKEVGGYGANVSATIIDSFGQERNVSIGDELPGLGKVKRITAHEVEFDAGSGTIIRVTYRGEQEKVEQPQAAQPNNGLLRSLLSR